MKALNDFKAFALRGNVIDMAVGIVIGAAFATIVASLVNDVLMPPLGMLLGGVDMTNLFNVLRDGTPPGPYISLAQAKAAGAVTINYGLLINAMVSFVLVAFAVFLMIRSLEAARRQPDALPDMKECPECAMAIPLKATRCPHCTSTLA